MNKETKELFNARANILKALGHPTRLYIATTLRNKSYCVQDITKMVGVDISTISKHLTVLKNAGIISYEKQGNKIFYKLIFPCVLDSLSCIEKIIKFNINQNQKNLNCCED